VIEETAVDEKDQNGLDEKAISFQSPTAGAGESANAPSVAGESQQDTEHISPASADNIRSQAVAAAPTPSAPQVGAEKQSEALESDASGSQSPDTAVSVTLSEPDKVRDAVVPAWTKFADLSIEQKFEQARLMDFEVRDAYLRERCRVAKMEVAHAASALNRATEIIESDLPFFLVHFEDMDAQGERSDLRGKVVGKTEWLRQNLPNLSRGTFYSAYGSVKARYAEQERLMLGGEVPPTPQPKTRTNDLTPIQGEVVTALVGQGFKNNDAILMVKAAEGQDFESLFKSALTHRTGGGNGSEVTVEADQGNWGNEARPSETGRKNGGRKKKPALLKAGEYREWLNFLVAKVEKRASECHPDVVLWARQAKEDIAAAELKLTEETGADEPAPSVLLLPPPGSKVLWQGEVWELEDPQAESAIPDENGNRRLPIFLRQTAAGNGNGSERKVA
jgi:hypothetical protein